MQKPKLKRTETIHQGYCSILIDHMEVNGDDLYPYTRIEFGFDATAILAETPDKTLVINKEFRYPTNTWLLSASGGKINQGETPVEGALRELLEETGYVSDQALCIGSIYPFPAMSSQKIYFIWAKNTRWQQLPTHEPLEQIETTIMTEKDLIQQIKAGVPVDGILCTALYLKSIIT